MTGYGRGECIIYNRKFVAEIKAVNHRYNDVTVKMPRSMFAYEDLIKKLLGEKVFRGKIDVYITFETFSRDDVSVSVNEAIADNYVDALKAINDRYSLEQPVTLEMIAKFPDVITVNRDTVNDSTASEIKEGLVTAVKEAVDRFVAMSTTEGENLKANMLEKLYVVKDIVDKVNERAPLVAKDYRQKLETKLRECIEGVEIDESRLMAEVLIFSDKACIDEEITRLYSHIAQMESIVNENNPVGRKLDFLVQEMNREVNTIGSKSNDLTITNHIVNAKSELEKIREQIQNVE
jgi:uncharacterized protein (TIGR00255 family)